MYDRFIENPVGRIANVKSKNRKYQYYGWRFARGNAVSFPPIFKRFQVFIFRLIHLCFRTNPDESSVTVTQSTKLGIDVNRHKEIIIKAVSAILLLYLKHFKINHVYQFEVMSQHLVFANCIPLVLKFFNQNLLGYVGSKNV